MLNKLFKFVSASYIIGRFQSHGGFFFEGTINSTRFALLTDEFFL